MVMSLTQGGSGFPFLAECIFDYICGVDIKDVKVTIDTVPDYDVYSSLRKVSLASFLLHCVTWECSSCIFKLAIHYKQLIVECNGVASTFFQLVF